MPCDPTDNQIPLILLEILRCLFFFLFCVRGYHHSSSFLGNHSLLISQNLREFKSSSYSPHDFLSLVFNFSGSHSPIIIIVNRQEGERVMKSLTAGRGQTSTVLHHLHQISSTYGNQKSVQYTNGLIVILLLMLLLSCLIVEVILNPF